MNTDFIIFFFDSALRTGLFQFVRPSVSDLSTYVRLHGFIVFYCTLLCSAVICTLHLIAINGTVEIKCYFVILHFY